MLITEMCLKGVFTNILKKDRLNNALQWLDGGGPGLEYAHFVK